MQLQESADGELPSHWFVGVNWDGERQAERFLEEGIWENGYDDRYLDEVRSMRPGDPIAMKAAFTRKTDLPFEAHGQSVSVMRILAIGTILENPGDGRRVYVRWERLPPRDWYFYTNRKTVWRVRPDSERAEKLIHFTFRDHPQDHGWWMRQPYWAERFRPGSAEFGWTGFYEAVADALLDWRSRREELAGLYHSVSMSVLAPEGTDPFRARFQETLPEVDPFTFMGLFNRRHGAERRHRIAAMVGEALRVEEPPPAGFDGIPHLNHNSTRFFSDTPERNRLTIERLWEVFETGHALRTSDEPDLRRQFEAAFDSAQLSKGVGFNLTIGLFWMSPWRFPSLDVHSRATIREHMSWMKAAADPDLLKVPPSGADYLALSDSVLERFKIGSPFKSIPDLVRGARAYNDALEPGDEAAVEAEAEGDGDEAAGGETAEQAAREALNTRFVSDDAEVERDELGRGVLAISFARRLHRIWCDTNPAPPPDGGDRDRAAFVIHIDAPWGGGKTSFAHFLARVLNPYGRPGSRPASFLEERYGRDHNFADLILTGRTPPADHRRPWITVWFNAWQAEDCSPPWWLFYQSIRKQCFAAIAREGDAAMEAGTPPPASKRWRRLPAAAALLRPVGWIVAGWLWAQELAWRLWNPKVRALLATTLLCFGLVWALFNANLLGIGAAGGVQLLLQNGVGFGLGALGAVSFIWAAGAVFTESLMPGTESLGERVSLGNGDPFERFRNHFRRMMEEVRRPVMVVIDDLDRCQPKFVVDLVRGMQTLLRSPRVVFVILGDREWIERSFETHHQHMSDCEAGGEQKFGARFAAKAIQMSFVLPEMDSAKQDDYVESILLPGARSRRAGGTPANAARRAVRNAAPDASPQAILEQVRGTAGDGVDPAELAKAVREERAIEATTSDRTESGIRHRLQVLAGCLPPNPRQIKRIINTVTMYHAVALQQGLPVDEEAPALALAAWVVLMAEWPESWRLIATNPALLDILVADDPEGALSAPSAPSAPSLPGGAEAFRDEVRRLAADERLIRLVRGEPGRRPPLTSASVRDFLPLTPVYARAPRKAAAA